MARPDDELRLPVKWEPCSNGEYDPPPMSPLVREAVRRAHEDAERTARRLGWSLRRFLGSLCGAAASLVALDACSRESSREQGDGEPGGSFDLPPESTTEPEAAADALAGDEFVMDVQGHLLEYDLDPATLDEPGLWRAFPQAACGEEDPRACYQIETFMEEIFLRSDTSLVVLSAIPFVGEAGDASGNPLSIEVMEQTRRVALALCEDERVLLHGQANPNVGPAAAALDVMGVLHAEHPIAAWKTYTHVPRARGWFLDDHDRSALQVGESFVRRAVDLGRPIICVHKGFSGGDPFASPVDIGPAAVAHPDATFVVYHSGYEADGTEGPYGGAAGAQGVDRLVATLEASGVGAGANVYAELGSTWRSVMASPDQAAHLLGKLLVAVGEDNILWGTDSIWYGSPQDQIQAFRAFRISDEYQERFGYPALTDEVKAKVLGTNAARLYGVDPPGVPCPFTREELQAAREAVPAAFRTYGPATTADLRRHRAEHGEW
ncbi:hypothetical protein BH24ACT3_BH24ACT3_16520 [soil metagenome]